MNISSLKFPQLAPSYHGVPRRYEETRPVVIQDFTHRKIVGIGHDIQRRLLDRLEREKTETVQAAEEAVRKEAEKHKKSAVRRVREEGIEQLQQRIEEERKVFEQKIKEECLKVEMVLQKQSIEQVQEERAKAEKTLKDTTKKMEVRCVQDLKEAVALARKEEKTIAAEQLEQLTQKHAAELEKSKKDAAEDKAWELASLTAYKDLQREKAVKETHEKEQKIAKEKLERLKHENDAALARDYNKVLEHVVEVEELKAEIANLKKEKERVGEYLMVTRKHFQDFINRMREFDAGQSDYMLPPAYLDEIEKGLMIAE